MKRLKFFNGRWINNGMRNVRGNVAAYTKLQAIELCNRAGHFKMTYCELQQYWSECWGNNMAAEPRELGVWLDKSLEKPVRVIGADGQRIPGTVEKFLESNQ